MNKTDYRIKSISGRTIALSSLRPGDWLDVSVPIGTYYWCIIKNSESKGEITMRRGGYSHIVSFKYDEWEHNSVSYMGRGKKRKWWSKLPKWLPERLKAAINPYSKP